MSLIPFGFWAASGGGGAANAYDLLETTTLTSSASSVTFSGLGSYSDYAHLQIRGVGGNDAVGTGFESLRLTFNGATNYSYHVLRANGSSFESFGGSRTTIPIFNVLGNNGASNVFGSFVTDVLDFANTSKNTTTRTLGGGVSGSSRIGLYSGAYLSTTAVTSLQLESDGANMIAGSRFSLYGIKAA